MVMLVDFRQMSTAETVRVNLEPMLGRRPPEINFEDVEEIKSLSADDAAPNEGVLDGFGLELVGLLLSRK